MHNTNHHSVTTEELSFNNTDTDSDESTQLQEVGIVNQPNNAIYEEQNELSKRFSKVNVTRNNEMQLDLFHLLKASNAPLVLFDRIMHWLRRHEGTIKSIGLTGLSN